jgi:hypothetical protein
MDIVLRRLGFLTTSPNEASQGFKLAMRRHAPLGAVTAFSDRVTFAC